MDTSHTPETITTDTSTTSTEYNATNDESSSPIITLNNNELDLPFFISTDKRTINKTKYYFINLLDITWKTNMTFNDYLNEINTFKNKFFDIKNYNEIALNQLQLKQIMDLRIKNKECMKNLVFLNHNVNKILRDVSQIESSHTNQIVAFNKMFDEYHDINQTHATKFRTYLIMMYEKLKPITDTNIFMRYAIKLEIDFETEKHRRKGLVFDWKCNTYDSINMYFEGN
jgi:hypothetical protein